MIFFRLKMIFKNDYLADEREIDLGEKISLEPRKKSPFSKIFCMKRNEIQQKNTEELTDNRKTYFQQDQTQFHSTELKNVIKIRHNA